MVFSTIFKNRNIAIISMLGFLALTLGVSVISGLAKLPNYITHIKERKKEKGLRALLETQGPTVNKKIDNLTNVYLSDSEFTKYFGEGNTAQGYVKQGNGKINAKTFINLESETCPILDYLRDVTDDIEATIAAGATPSIDDYREFTIPRIMSGASMYSSINNDSLTPGLINTEVSESIDKLLGQYIANGIIEKRLLNPALPASATNFDVYLLNPEFNDDRTNKRYAVESGVVKFLGCLDKNYSSFENGQIITMPLFTDNTMKITNDEKFNKDVLEKVLLNSESARLTNGSVITKAAGGWKEVIDSFVNRDILLAPEQYVNYTNLLEKYRAEEEDKKKKANQLALAQGNRAPVSA